MGPARRWDWRLGDEGLGKFDRRTAVSNPGASALHQMSGRTPGTRTSRRCSGRCWTSQWSRQLVVFRATNVGTRDQRVRTETGKVLDLSAQIFVEVFFVIAFQLKKIYLP